MFISYGGSNMKKNTFFNLIMIVISCSITLGAGLLGGWYLCQQRFTGTDLFWKYQYQKLPLAEQKKVEEIVASGKSPSLEDFYIVPNALWHHSLNPRRQDNEINSQGFRNPEMSAEELTKGPLIGNNVMLCGPEEAVVMEISAGRSARRRPEGGLLTATNHYQPDIFLR